MIQMRLTRYFRQGLLSRRRASRGFEYSLAKAGEDRLMYFWEKFGEMKADPQLTPAQESLRIKKYRQMIGNLDSRVTSLSRVLGEKSGVDFSKTDTAVDQEIPTKIDRSTSIEDVGGASPVSPEDEAIAQLFHLVWGKDAAGVDSVPLEQTPPTVVKYIESHAWFNPQADFYGLQIGNYWYLLYSKGLLRTT
jgi:hypothetical protein